MANLLPMTTSFTVKELLSFGWTAFQKRPWFFVGTVLVYAIIQFVLGALQEAMPGAVSFLLSFFVSTLISLGLMSVYLKAHEDTAAPTLKDLWNPAPFWRYLGASILIALAVGVGLLLLIVPGIIVALGLSMGGYLVIDKGYGPIKALKESWAMTRGSRVKLFLFALAVLALGIIGAIPFGLGLLVVAPVTMLATVHAYRTLAHASAEVVTTAPSLQD